MKGILLTVLRSSLGDCTNNGITSKENTIMLVGEGVPEIFEVKEGECYLELETMHTGNKRCKVINDPRGKKTHMGMFGGNYVTTSDSRFSKVSNYPLPVLDRFES